MAGFDPDAYLKKKQTAAPTTAFDPDAYLTKTAPESVAETLGRSTASLADTALNLATGTLDYAAYPFARAYYGLTMDDQAAAAARAQQETTSPKDIVGRTLGITGTQGYESAPLRRMGTAAGEFIGESVVQPVAGMTGLPEQDIGNMLGTTMFLAPGAGRAVGNTVKATGEFAGGAAGALTGRTARPGAVPEPWQTASVRQPVGSVYYTPEQLQAWRNQQIATADLTPQPIQQLGPDAIKALARTEGNIPYAGKGWRAAGEQLGETYRNPINLLTDVGLDVLTGSPIPTAMRTAYKGYKGFTGAQAAKQLEKAGFTPMTVAEQQALAQGLPHPSGAVIPPRGPIAPGGSGGAGGPGGPIAPASGGPGGMISTFSADEIIPPVAPAVWKNPRQPEAPASSVPPGQQATLPVAPEPISKPTTLPVKPEGPMEMKTTGGLEKFANEQAFLEQQMMDTLAEKITGGSYVKDGLRYEITPINYNNAPKGLLKDKPKITIRVFDDKTNTQLSGPAAEEAAKSVRQQVEDIFAKNRKKQNK